jgi:serine protease
MRKTQIRWMKFTQPLVALAVTGLMLLSSAQASPLGSTFRVDASPTNTARIQQVVAGANGDMLVLFYDSSGSYMQRYDSSGRALQAQPWSLGQGVQRAALDRSGNFVLLYQTADGSGDGVYAALYDRAGNLRVNMFRVNDQTTGNQTNPLVAMNANGEFAVAWIGDYNPTTTTSEVYVKRFRANGTAVAPETRASIPDGGRSWVNGIAMDGFGNFTVTWTRTDLTINRQDDVYMRRFNSVGAALANPVRVNTVTADVQANGSVAMSPQGDTVVVWETCYQDGPAWSVRAQRYNSAGAPVGGELLVNGPISGQELGEPVPHVAMLESGGFVVAWRNWTNTDSRPVVREFLKDGTAAGPVYDVESTSGVRSEWPVLDVDPAGNYLVAWNRDYLLGYNHDVFARRGVVDTLPPITTMLSGQTATNLSGAAGSWRYFKITVPAGATTLDVALSGPSTTGDADLYLRYAGLPNAQTFDARPYLNGSNERVVFTNIPPGDWYIGVNGYTSYSSVSLTTWAY